MLPSEISNYPLAEQTRAFLRTRTFGHVIGAEMRQSATGETLPIYEPASGLQFARVALASRAEVDAAVQSARESFDDGRWRKLAPLQRERCLHKLSQLLDAHRELLSDLDVLEGGVLRGYSGFMVQLGIDIVDYYAGWPTKMHMSISALPRPCRCCVSPSGSLASSCPGMVHLPYRSAWFPRWPAVIQWC